mmetsp:Transcript_127142/g.354032  ORF Transcript_127142/g.354032 Transcript_127142/m.354032 type:complete len:83 (+) Transcript_127142:1423-1671(+)
MTWTGAVVDVCFVFFHVPGASCPHCMRWGRDAALHMAASMALTQEATCAWAPLLNSSVSGVTCPSGSLLRTLEDFKVLGQVL